MSRADFDVGVSGELDAYITERADDLVALTCSLVQFETVSVDLAPESEHRTNDEAALQQFVAGVLADIGASVDQWEPDPRELRDHPMMPPWHHWEDRPLTVATLRGSGGGRSLIINGHIDVVSRARASAGPARRSRPRSATAASTAAVRWT